MEAVGVQDDMSMLNMLVYYDKMGSISTLTICSFFQGLHMINQIDDAFLFYFLMLALVKMVYQI